MKESVANDFSRYGSLIEQLYKQHSRKRLAVDGILVCLLIISLGVVPIVLKVSLIILVGPFILIEAYQNGLRSRKEQVFIEELKEFWQARIEELDWADPETIVYEDEKNYYIKRMDEQFAISKKGSRTLPSEIRGISLIIGENKCLLAKEAPIFVIYCDTTEIKPLDLTKQTQAILKNIKWTRFKNKVLRPLGLLVILIIVLLYILGII